MIESLSLTSPSLLWLTLILPVVAILLALIRRQRRRRLVRFASPSAMTALFPRPSRWNIWLTMGASLGVSMLLFAIAGPRWGQTESPEVMPGRDVVILLDMSRSMLATDSAPTRFEQARAASWELVRAMQKQGGHRIGLVVFANDAQIIVPLTNDYAHFLNRVALLEVDFPPMKLRPRSDAVSGTRLGAGLRTANAAHDPAQSGFQDTIVFSDGDDPLGDADWQAGLRDVADAGVPIHTVGIGDSQKDSPVPGMPNARTRLQVHPLREIARRTGGHYLDAGIDAPRIVEFYQQRIESKPVNARTAAIPPQPPSRHVWFYLLATLLLAGAWFVGSYERGST
jgi:Ca-activated chloride channel family protein